MDFDFSKPHKLVNGAPVLLTEAEIAERLANDTAWAADANKRINAAIDEQIRSLEVKSGGYMRGLREFMLAMAEVTRAAGGPDFMTNKGMQNVKALDDQIRELRSQRVPE